MIFAILALYCWLVFSAIELIKALLKVDMNARLSVSQAYCHSWIKEVFSSISHIKLYIYVYQAMFLLIKWLCGYCKEL